MVSSWESVVVAIGIILLFYFAKRYTPRYKNPRLKKDLRSKEEVKPLEMILTNKSVKQTPLKQKNTSNAGANLVMHPHSFERAKKEYLQFAHKFSGLYEVLYLSFSGKLTAPRQEQLLKSWEEGILSTEARNFILAWNTIIQKHCGRNFYFKGNPKLKSETTSEAKNTLSEEERILQDWLKTLLKWGLHREPRPQIQSQMQSESSGGEAVSAQELAYYWVLNGEVLEEGRATSSVGQ